ncbi:MAG: murein biosynthesis protein MurJ, partial [Yaniella sp.]|nr:murein biosynthesis protein MurJ [Yaniella sp.]
MTETPQAEQANPDPKDASRSRSLAAKASALMAAGTIISRVLGFVRTSLLAIAIGSTALVADVFETANTIPNVIYMLLAGGVFNVVLVPQIIKQAKKADRGADYTSRLITLAALLIGAFTIAITLLAAPIIDGLTLNWAGPKLALGTAFALWTLPQIFFYGMYAVIGQVLNAHGRFGAYMWAPVANNIIAIGFILFYIVMFGPYVVMPDTQQFSEWTTTHTIVLAGGHTLGILVQAVVLLWPLKRLGLGLKPKFGWKGMGLRHTGRLAGFTIVTMMVGNISNLMINRLVTGATEARSQLDDPFEQAAIPGLQALNIGQLITVLPHSVFVLSIATVLFNHLARSMQDEDLETARRTTGSGLRTFAVPMMISVVGIIVLAPTVARLFASTADTAIVSAHAIAQILLILA